MPVLFILKRKSRVLTLLMASAILFVAPMPVRALVDDSKITISSATDVSNKRAALIQYIWGATGFPRNKMPSAVATIPSPVDNIGNLERVDEIRIAMDAGEQGLALHFIPAKRKNNRLVILHQGHDCTFNDNPALEDVGYGMQRTINALLHEGYSVLGVYMVRMTPGNCINHAGIFNIPVTGGSPMKLFLEPVAVSLNYLKTQSSAGRLPRYQEFNMVGLSGGGWTTTVYAAIDPTIKFSFPVAGTIPLYLRTGGSVGDEEQIREDFYQIAGYPDLYVMGSYGAGRKQVQILKRHDDCCFGQGQHDAVAAKMSYVEATRNYEAQVRQVVHKLGSGMFRLEIDEAGPHTISHNAIFNVILSELNDSRRTVGASTGTDAFVRGINGNLWHRGPGGWKDLGYAMVGVPAVLQGAVNDFDIFFRDAGNHLKHLYTTKTGWAIEDLGVGPAGPVIPRGTILTDPVVASWGKGRFDVVAVGAGYRLYHWWWSSTNSSWVAPAHAETNINLDPGVGNALGIGPPALVAPGVNRLDIFFRGFDRAVHRANSNGQTPWTLDRPGGTIVDFPSAITTGGNTLRVYVRDENSHLLEARQTDGGPWQWSSLSDVADSKKTSLSGSPSASVRGDVVTVHARTSAGNLSSFTLAKGAWGFLNHGHSIAGSPTSTPDGAFVMGSATSTEGKSDGLWLFNGTKWTSLGQRP